MMEVVRLSEIIAKGFPETRSLQNYFFYNKVKKLNLKKIPQEKQPIIAFSKFLRLVCHSRVHADPLGSLLDIDNLSLHAAIRIVPQQW
jgi:hypothetical protein